MIAVRLFSTLCLGVLLVKSWVPTYPADYQSCQKITVPLCQGSGMKYNLTRLPNHIGHTDQAAIRHFTEQNELTYLVSTKCSSDLVFFLCATLVPICVNDRRFQTPPMAPPCRNLCEKVYNDCISSMRKRKFLWPRNLKCSGLPNHATGMCIEPNSFVTVKGAVKVRASCEARSWKKNFNLRSKNLSKFDHIFRAKLISANRDKTRIRLSVPRFFEPSSKNMLRVHINVRNCKSFSKFLSNKKMFLVLANERNHVLKISEITEWKSGYSKILRKYTKNNNRLGKSG